MLRTTLIAATLLAASGGALAHGSYYGPAPVYRSDPSVMITYGSPGYGFSLAYGPGGYGYWAPPPYPPGRVIVAPPPYRVKHIHHYRHHYRDPWRGDSRRGWDDHGRHDRRHDDRRPHSRY